MQLAAVLWEWVAAAQGYVRPSDCRPPVGYPSFQQQYAELQRVTPTSVRSDNAAELWAHAPLPNTVA